MKKEIKQELLSEGKYHKKVKDYYLKNYGYNLLQVRNKCYCGKCGNEIETYYCPTCNIKLHKIREYNKFKGKSLFDENVVCIRVIESKKDYIETEIYLVSHTEEIKKSSSEIYSYLIGREIFLDDKYYMARKRKTINYYFRYKFDLKSELKIKNEFFFQRYSFVNNIIINDRNRKYKYLDLKLMRVLKTLKIFSDFRSDYFSSMSLGLADILKAYNRDSKLYETLQNCKRYDLLAYYIKYCYRDTIKPAIMTMLKNNKQIPNCNWSDYIVGLSELNKDLKNIKVVCPDDYIEQQARLERKLKKMHDLAELNENVIKYQADYEERLKSIINHDFGNDTYSIEVIPSIKSFYDEAEHYCNCCYRMGYYKRENSLVFTIKHKLDNSRVEMLELLKDNNKWVINQCYGVGNKYSIEHEQIINYINNEMLRKVGAII
jgi:hypothetical protein